MKLKLFKVMEKINREHSKDYGNWIDGYIAEPTEEKAKEVLQECNNLNGKYGESTYNISTMEDITEDMEYDFDYLGVINAIKDADLREKDKMFACGLIYYAFNEVFGMEDFMK